MPRNQDGHEVIKHLGSIVEVEARRAVSEAEIEPDPARIADGWTRRFVTDAKRADEAVELYRELGYQACADPVRQEEIKGDCEDCTLLILLQFKMVYTRK